MAAAPPTGVDWVHAVIPHPAGAPQHPGRRRHGVRRRAADAAAPIFSRRYLALPPIREVRDQDGAWGTVGQTRTIVLADRGTMLETLTSVRPGTSFGYDIEPVSGPLKPLVVGAQGLWSFAPAGNGVEVAWQWVVEPTRAGAPVMPAFGRMWQGYARQALEEVERALLEG